MQSQFLFKRLTELPKWDQEGGILERAYFLIKQLDNDPDLYMTLEITKDDIKFIKEFYNKINGKNKVQCWQFANEEP